MTYDRDHIDGEDWKEIYNAAVERFLCGDIKEEEFRKELARLGFNATDIETEVRIYTK